MGLGPLEPLSSLAAGLQQDFAPQQTTKPVADGSGSLGAAFQSSRRLAAGFCPTAVTTKPVADGCKSFCTALPSTWSVSLEAGTQEHTRDPVVRRDLRAGVQLQSCACAAS
jgi:hypothetical protein